jgi:hypothetical protein
MTAKKNPARYCESPGLKAESKNTHALYSAPAFESQSLTEALRLSRLARAGLSLAHASILAPLAFGEARQ